MSNTKQYNKSNPQIQIVIYPIQLKKMTDREIREYHLKRLERLSKIERSKIEFKVDGSIWKDGKPIAEDPTFEQKEWFVRKMKRRFI